MIGLAALAFAAALQPGQRVSERVVQELVALPTADRFVNQIKAREFILQGEDRAAAIIIDALPRKTAGNLYERYKRDGNAKRMLHEVQESFYGPEPLPEVVEEAVYHGGIERALAALAYMQEHGFSSARNYLRVLTTEGHECSRAGRTGRTACTSRGWRGFRALWFPVRRRFWPSWSSARTRLR